MSAKPASEKQNTSRNRKKKVRKRPPSMRLLLFLTILLLAGAPLMILPGLLRDSVSDQIINSDVERFQNQCAVISTQYLNRNIDETERNAELAESLRMLADIFEGRIVLVNRNYEIIFDTYGLEVGKLCIYEDIVRAYRGEESTQYTWGRDSVRFVRPVAGAESQDFAGVLMASMAIGEQERAMNVIETRAVMITTVLISCVAVLAGIACVLFARPFRRIAWDMEKAARDDMNIELEVYFPKEGKRISEAYNTIQSRLRILNDSRQEFVSNVSHELKTPITSIRVLADSLIMQEDADVGLYREFMSDISDEIERESKIIDDLLTLVRLDKTDAGLNIAQVNINEIVELTLKRLTPIAKQRDISLTLETFRPIVADADEVKLTLAITNLVENAIKYNVEGGWVRVSLNADHKHFFIKVMDSGIGIPESSLESVFERFYRVDKTRSRETGGTGLGLAITRNIIVKHHGAIRVYSKENEGTTFIIRIPLTYVK